MFQLFIGFIDPIRFSQLKLLVIVRKLNFLNHSCPKNNLCTNDSPHLIKVVNKRAL